MAKNQPQSPLVTSVSTKLKKTFSNQDTSICSTEEIKEKKKGMLSLVDQSLEVFKKNLQEGKVEMTTSLDLERIVKLTLLLSGEADSITGKPNGESEEETTISTKTLELSMSKIDEILDLSDPEVKSLYEKITRGYNELNDVDE